MGCHLCFVSVMRPLSPLSLTLKTAKTRRGAWLVVLLVLAEVVLPASGQTPAVKAVAQRPDSLVQAAQEDTTYALQRLFFAQRKRNLVYGAVLFPLVLVSEVRVFSAYAVPNSTEKRITTSLVSGGYFLLFARRLQLLYRYRAGRERRLELALQENKPLPDRIRRALKKDYFSTQTTGK